MLDNGSRSDPRRLYQLLLAALPAMVLLLVVIWFFTWLTV
jgi:hypothetical protein